MRNDQGAPSSMFCRRGEGANTNSLALPVCCGDSEVSHSTARWLTKRRQSVGRGDVDWFTSPQLDGNFCEWLRYGAPAEAQARDRRKLGIQVFRRRMMPWIQSTERKTVIHGVVQFLAFCGD